MDNKNVFLTHSLHPLGNVRICGCPLIEYACIDQNECDISSKSKYFDDRLSSSCQVASVEGFQVAEAERATDFKIMPISEKKNCGEKNEFLRTTGIR